MYICILTGITHTFYANVIFYCFFFYHKVSTDIANKLGWKQCFQVNEVKLPTGYYIGISSTTGDLSDNHDILSIRFYELDLPDDVSTDEKITKVVLSVVVLCLMLHIIRTYC